MEEITQDELEHILKNLTRDSLGYTTEINFATNELLQALLEIFKEAKLTSQDVREIIYGAKAAIMHGSDRYIKFSKKENFDMLIEVLLKEKDLSIFKSIEVADSLFQKYFNEYNLSHDKLGNVMQSLWKLSVKEFLDKTAKTTKKITLFSKETVEIYNIFAGLYYSIIAHVGEIPSKKLEGVYLREVDRIIVEKIATNKTAIKGIIEKEDQLTRFNEFLHALRFNSNKNIAFTAEEVALLLNSTSSIVANASAEKWNMISKKLEKHIEDLSNLYNDTEIRKAFNSKKLLLKSGTIIGVKPSNIETTSKLLLGQTIYQALSTNIKEVSKSVGKNVSSAKKYILYKLLPNLAIVDIDRETNTYILKERVTTFANLNTNSIYDLIENLSTCLYRAYGLDSDIVNIVERVKFLKSKGFDFEKMITKDNLFELFPRKILEKKNKLLDYNESKTDLSENIIENVKIFTKLISSNDIQKIIQHNFNFLCQDPQILLNKIKEIALLSSDLDAFKTSFEEYINQIIKNSGVKVKDDVSALKISATPRKRLAKSKKDEIQIENYVLDKDFLATLGLDNAVLGQVEQNNVVLMTEETQTEDNYSTDEINSIVASIDEGNLEDDEKDSLEDEYLPEKLAKLCDDFKGYINDTIEHDNFYSYSQISTRKGFIQGVRDIFENEDCQGYEKEACVKILRDLVEYLILDAKILIDLKVEPIDDNYKNSLLENITSSYKYDSFVNEKVQKLRSINKKIQEIDPNNLVFTMPTKENVDKYIKNLKVDNKDVEMVRAGKKAMQEEITERGKIKEFSHYVIDRTIKDLTKIINAHELEQALIVQREQEEKEKAFLQQKTALEDKISVLESEVRDLDQEIENITRRSTNKQNFVDVNMKNLSQKKIRSSYLEKQQQLAEDYQQRAEKLQTERTKKQAELDACKKALGCFIESSGIVESEKRNKGERK